MLGRPKVGKVLLAWEHPQKSDFTISLLSHNKLLKFACFTNLMINPYFHHHRPHRPTSWRLTSKKQMLWRGQVVWVEPSSWPESTQAFLSDIRQASLTFHLLTFILLLLLRVGSPLPPSLPPSPSSLLNHLACTHLKHQHTASLQKTASKNGHFGNSFHF